MNTDHTTNAEGTHHVEADSDRTVVNTQRLAILLLDPDAIEDDAAPNFADYGNIPLATNGVILPDELLVVHLRSTEGAKQWIAAGVLRGVTARPDGNVGFSRWESIATGEDLGAPLGTSAVDQLVALATWPGQIVDRALKAGGRVWSSGRRARQFAQYLSWAFTGTALLRKSAARALRDQAPAHHLFHRQIKFWLSEFLRDNETEGMAFQIDTDGLLREGTARVRYTLMGSYVQPATSIVSPFRCAIDYTVQTDPTTGLEIRQGLLDSWAHVASGSYDAAVRVVILRTDTPHPMHSYLSLRHIGTRNILEQLKAAGVYLALLGPGSEEDSRS